MLRWGLHAFVIFERLESVPLETILLLTVCTEMRKETSFTRAVYPSKIELVIKKGQKFVSNRIAFPKVS